MGDTSFAARYQRNFDTLSLEEQIKLEESSATIIGLGGLGGGVAEMLARTGVGRIRMIDGDVFDETNLNRQLLSEEHLIGVSKADAAKKRITAVNSEIKTEAIHTYVDEENLLGFIKDVDVVVDCLDSIDTRFVLQDAARNAGVPIVSGAIAGVTGQVTVIFPEDRGYEVIYGRKSREQSRGVELKTGNISYCALFVSALQASECIKVLLKKGDILRNKMLIAQLWNNMFDVVSLE